MRLLLELVTLKLLLASGTLLLSGYLCNRVILLFLHGKIKAVGLMDVQYTHCAAWKT